jgi:hypothetical protein
VIVLVVKRQISDTERAIAVSAEASVVSLVNRFANIGQHRTARSLHAHLKSVEPQFKKKKEEKSPHEQADSLTSRIVDDRWTTKEYE